MFNQWVRLAAFSIFCAALTAIPVDAQGGAPPGTFSWKLSLRAPVRHPGTVKSLGSIRFVSKNSFTWAGSAADVCPADGLSSLTQFELFFTDQASAMRYRMHTTHRCGSGWQDFDGKIRTAKEIAYVRVRVDTATKHSSPTFVSAAYVEGDNPFS